MELKLANWGNSKAIRLPQKLLREAKIIEGDTSFIASVENGNILLTQKKSGETLFQKLMQDNKGLKVRPKENIEWGTPVGDEYW